MGSDKGIEYLIKGVKAYTNADVSNFGENYSYYYQDDKGQDILKNIVKGAYKNFELRLVKILLGLIWQFTFRQRYKI